MKRKVVVLLTFVVVLIVIGGAVFTFIGRGGGEQSAQGGTSETGDMAPVRAPDVVAADAKAVPVRSAQLSLASSGIVSEALVLEGDRVETGQVLLRLGADAERAAVEQARASLQRAEAQLALMKAGARPPEIEAAKASVDVAEAQLSKVRVAGPPVEVSMAEAEVRRAAAQLELIMAGDRPQAIAIGEADVASARAALLQAEAALQATELRAPFAGVVASLSPGLGEYVAPGTPIVWLADDSSWTFVTEDLTELAVVRVREGDSAIITVDALPELKIQGRVASIKPMGENRLGDIIYKAVIIPDQNDPRLLWNMTAAVTIGGP